MVKWVGLVGNKFMDGILDIEVKLGCVFFIVKVGLVLFCILDKMFVYYEIGFILIRILYNGFVYYKFDLISY